MASSAFGVMPAAMTSMSQGSREPSLNRRPLTCPLPSTPLVAAEQ